MSLNQSSDQSDQSSERGWWLFQPGQTPCKYGRRGYAAQREAECRRLQMELLAELPREPTAIERHIAEAIAAQIIEGRRLRSQGRSSLENDRLVGRLAPLLLVKASPDQVPAVDVHAYLAEIARRDVTDKGPGP